MLPRSVRAALAALALALASACGARSAPREPDPRDAAAAPDARVVRGLCEWPPTRELAQLTDGDGRKRMGTATVLDASVLVGFTQEGGAEHAFRAIRIGLLGNPAGATAQTAVVGPVVPGGALGALSLATREGRAAAITWADTDGCLFAPLADDGRAAAPGRRVGVPRCGDLLPSSTGFSLLGAQADGRASYIVQLAPDGSPLPLRPGMDLAVDVEAPAVRAAAPDGSFVLIGGDRDLLGNVGGLRVQRYAADGTPAGEPRPLLPPATTVRLPRVVATETGFVAAWIVPARSPPDGRGTVFAMALDAQGGPTTPPVPVPGSADAASTSQLAFAAAHTDALMIWTRVAADPRAVDLVIQALGPQANARIASQVALRDERLSPDSVRLLPTPLGALLFFAREVSPARNELFAFSLACLR